MDEETRPGTAKVVFPESGSRIDAAARVLSKRDNDDGLTVDDAWDWYVEVATQALAAADEAEAPIAEKLAAALAAMVIAADAAGWGDDSPELNHARVVLESRASVPVENRGTES